VITRISGLKLSGFGGLLFLLAVLAFPARGFAQAPPQFVYVTNFYSHNVSAYSVDATTGALTPVAGSPFATGAYPYGLARIIHEEVN